MCTTHLQKFLIIVLKRKRLNNSNFLRNRKLNNFYKIRFYCTVIWRLNNKNIPSAIKFKNCQSQKQKWYSIGNIRQSVDLNFQIVCVHVF